MFAALLRTSASRILHQRNLIKAGTCQHPPLGHSDLFLAKSAVRRMACATGERSNRLVDAKSPYLLQHASNPVDWYPWGEEAFEKAKKENKLIFLSVGYSTCHWCHVMERESFESDEVAQILNANYVSIKVDREERPDVDAIYMGFVQRTTGSGGWPMSVFLTPTLEPVFGGTYFPPNDMYGRIGFKSLLRLIAKQWREKHETIHKEAVDTVNKLKKLSTARLDTEKAVPDHRSWEKCFEQLSKSYEPICGGFGEAPKFPQPTNFNFLFHLYGKQKSSPEGRQALEFCLFTLRKMAYGGIHDHVNKGFARYSVDNKWHLPHFEKMLYDQGQLLVAYVDAYVVSKDAFFAEVADDIMGYVSRDLSHPEGGFYGAEDADSYPAEGAKEKKEGAFCVWEYDEIEQLLKDLHDPLPHLEVYVHHFNIRKQGNVNPANDPHGELLDKNVVSCQGSYEETADTFNITVDEVKKVLKTCNELLYDKRQERPKPSKDTKIVTAWNGLMLAGCAKAGFAMNKAEYSERAVSCAKFIKKYLTLEDGSLLRCCYKGEGDEVVQTGIPIAGFLDDYAFLIRGLLNLYDATMDSSWLQWAESLQGIQDMNFWDDANAGYFDSAAATDLIVRNKDENDGAEPCGNSVAVHNLIRLAAYLDRPDLRQKAERTLTAFSERLTKIPVALPEMVSALMLFHSTPTQVFIAGETDDNDTQALIDVVRTRFLPGRILAVADGPQGRGGLLYARHQLLAKLRPVQGKPAAYVCRNFACSLPVTEPQDLATSLDAECN